MNKIKNENGVTLINLIIIILLALILIVLLYLAYTNMNKEEAENNNLANNTNQELNLDSNQNQQNNLDEKDEINNNSSLDNLDEKDETNNNSSVNDLDENATEIDEENSSSEQPNSATSTNQYKIGDTVDIVRNKMLIRIDSVEPYTSDTGYEMKKAKVTFKNYNDQDLENLSPLYYMIKAVSVTELGDAHEEVEFPLKFRLGNYENNILDKKAPAGETITGYIYWQSSNAEYIKISPITGIIDADNDEYSYGDPYYIDITE